ncbi:MULTISPECIES: hypothetical protein [Acidithiobacillus]|uniref:Uncharacterized protein n=1 Tax=Acidithiobacillus thiooxidans TaxID=930 RepID=A0A1C2J9C4_ACITH|nr:MULTISPECIES: hypothetical protein [Acidithiobacillus]MBU2843270.1 hypothetical protein [Acidithiobacillus thiooxidans]OCX70870.1 hypothetical protein A6M23_13005 [Acidithiobacillus thiooxidans]OCX70940.1 hypothetical protein A6P07_13110 [Acidithiobacillus thiooxidans]OCX78803.1 hypothetical protein A6O24_03465 [Acidithiobacillus thiooxidans]OCX84826.1 hypothetical protein A6O26_03320 [Acidithiobacillus thiooxidans]
MARIGHRRILLRFYDDTPQHQEILRWIDGYSGRGLQDILRGALLIGLPQLLGNPLQGAGPLQGADSSDSGFDVKPSVPQAMPDKTSMTTAHRKESAQVVPDFVASQVAKSMQAASPVQGANPVQGASPLQNAKLSQDVKKQVGSSSPAVRTEQEKEAHQEVVRSALQQILEDD